MVSIGIDIGGTNIVVGLVEDKHSILDKKTIPTCIADTPEETVEKLEKIIKEILTKNQYKIEDLLQIGIGVPGNVHPITRELLYANNLEWYHVDFIKLFQKYFQVSGYSYFSMIDSLSIYRVTLSTRSYIS